MKSLNLAVIILLITTGKVWAQNSFFKADIKSTVVVSSQNEIPFWLRANTGFEFSEFTNFSGVINGIYRYDFDKFQVEAGAYIFARDGVENSLQRRDLFIQANNEWLKITIGSKQRDEAFFGLSSTNQNFLISNNARPLPGLIIESNDPLTISKIFKIDWGIAHYELNDDRFVDNTRIHYKRFNVITSLSKKSKLTLGIQHFAQWGGTSKSLGNLSDDINAFWNVFKASKAKDSNVENEAFNALGNHLGTYLLNYDFSSKLGVFSLYHEHPFEDGSGSRLQNFEDGVWGITFLPENNKILKGILYEYVDTRDQSGTAPISGQDNYFSNKIYRSGWTYEQNIIGMPFFKVDKTLDVNSGIRPVVGSRFQVHHLGVQAIVKDVTLTTRMSYSKNIGNYGSSFQPSIKDFYFSTQALYTYKIKHVFTLLTGLDISNTTNSIFAGGLSYNYQF